MTLPSSVDGLELTSRGKRLTAIWALSSRNRDGGTLVRRIPTDSLVLLRLDCRFLVFFLCILDPVISSVLTSMQTEEADVRWSNIEP